MPPTLAGKKLLITSGPTHASIDAVRYLSNRSSGRLGSRIAVEALALGARVTMVVGPDSATPPREDLSEDEWARLHVIPVETVTDLLRTLEEELTRRERYDAVLHAMAVLDYVPEHEEKQKVRSGKDTWSLKLVRTPKIIQQIKVWSPRMFLVGFKLEVDKPEARLREIGAASLRENRADLVVANDLSQIRDERHPALIIGSDGNVLNRPQTKSEIARDLCRILARALEELRQP